MPIVTLFVLAVAAVVSNSGTLTGKVQDDDGVPIDGAIGFTAWLAGGLLIELCEVSQTLLARIPGSKSLL